MKYICFNALQEEGTVYFCHFPLERFGVFFNRDLLCIDGREAVKTGGIVCFYSIPYPDHKNELLKKELNKAIFNFLNSKEQNCFNLTIEASKIYKQLKADGTYSKMKELEKFQELKKEKGLVKEPKQLTVEELEELIEESKEKT